jgi:hypothetical protein
MRERTPWILSTCVFGALCIASSLVAIKMSKQLEEQAPRLERRDNRCHVERFTAANASENLRKPEPSWREFGLVQFKNLELGGWQMANMCSPVTVGASCADNDLPCQLAALDWAMVNIR